MSGEATADSYFFFRLGDASTIPPVFDAHGARQESSSRYSAQWANKTRHCPVPALYPTFAERAMGLPLYPRCEGKMTPRQLQTHLRSELPSGGFHSGAGGNPTTPRRAGGALFHPTCGTETREHGDAVLGDMRRRRRQTGRRGDKRGDAGRLERGTGDRPERGPPLTWSAGRRVAKWPRF